MSVEGILGRAAVRLTEIKVPKIDLPRIDMRCVATELRSVLEAARNLDQEGGRILRDQVEKIIGYPGSTPTNWMLEDWIASLERRTSNRTR